MITKDYLSLSSLGPYLKKLHYRAIYRDIDLYADSADLTVAHNISLQVLSSCVRQRNHLICDAEQYDQWDLSSVIRAPSRPLLPQLSPSSHTIHIPFPASYLNICFYSSSLFHQTTTLLESTKHVVNPLLPWERLDLD